MQEKTNGQYVMGQHFEHPENMLQIEEEFALFPT